MRDLIGNVEGEKKGISDYFIDFFPYVLAAIMGILLSLVLMILMILSFSVIKPEWLSKLPAPYVTHLCLSVLCVPLAIWFWRKIK